MIRVLSLLVPLVLGLLYAGVLVKVQVQVMAVVAVAVAVTVKVDSSSRNGVAHFQ